MPWLPGDIWQHKDKNVDELLQPAINKYSSVASIISVIKTLSGWYRFDLIDDLYKNLPPTTRKYIKALYPNVYAPKDPVKTIGRRKRNTVTERLEGEGVRAIKRRNFPGVDKHILNPCSIYLPSLKIFLRGEVGHIYTGILVCPDNKDDKQNHQRRDKEMIFLVPNNPPTKEQQSNNSITEPYLNKEFTEDVLNGPGPDREFGDEKVKVTNTFGLQRKDGVLNNTPVVHGGNENTSHNQLKQMIIECNRYQGITINANEVNHPAIPTLFVGFTVMKGGKNPYDLKGEPLKNVYGWTSSSLNKEAFKDASKGNKDALESLLKLKMMQQNSASNRMAALVTNEFREKITIALDRLLELQVKDPGKDRYFKEIISKWGADNI